MTVGIAPVTRRIVIWSVLDENVPVTDVTKIALIAVARDGRKALLGRERHFQSEARFLRENGPATVRAMNLPHRRAEAIALIAETVEHLRAIGRLGIARALLRQAQETWA